MVWFCVCVAPLGDWVNGGCINVLVPKCGKFTLGKYDFSSLGVRLILGNGYGI